MNAKNNLGRCGEEAAVEYLERAGLHTVSSVSDRRLPSIAPSSKNSPEGLPLLGVASLTHGVINDDYSMTDLPKDGLEVIMDGSANAPSGDQRQDPLARAERPVDGPMPLPGP
jgi:hypothetical protein